MSRYLNGCRKLFFAFIVCLLVHPLQANAVEKWVILGNTGWVSGDSRLTLNMPSVSHPDLVITSSTAADLQWIATQIPVNLGGTIKAVFLCYKTPNTGTFISQVRLTEYLVPGTATVMHDDGTDLISSAGSCYLSPVNYAPLGSVNLNLRLNFANSSHSISLGALAVLIDQ